VAAVAVVALRAGVFTAPVAAEIAPRAVAAGARDDGIIDVPGEAATLQMALDACRDGDTIRLSAGTHAGGARVNGRSVQIVGAGALRTIVRGPGPGPVLAIAGSRATRVVLEGFAIEGGRGADGSGVRIVGADVQIRSATVRDNDGSGVLAERDAFATLADCALVDNRSPFAGGGLRVVGGTALAVNCSFAGNMATTFGGAVYAAGGQVDLLSCTFDENGTTAGAFGGAVYGQECALTVVESQFARNASREAGGAVYTEGGTGAIERCTFTGNLADGAWAVYSRGGSVRLASSRLCGRMDRLIGGSLLQEGGNIFDAECFPDCNGNGVSDAEEIARGWARDLDGNGIPDDCEVRTEPASARPWQVAGGEDTPLDRVPVEDDAGDGARDAPHAIADPADSASEASNAATRAPTAGRSAPPTPRPGWSRLRRTGAADTSQGAGEAVIRRARDPRLDAPALR
jgi:hypothetical protein